MKKITRSKRQQILDSYRAKVMPEIKKLVKKYGRKNVAWCINQLREYEKKVIQLEQLKKEAKKLEKEIS